MLVQEYRTLNDGNSIPVMGLGVFKVDQETTARIVQEALQAGIGLVDTAKAYQNEAAVGIGIQNAGVAREDFFVTTKIWNSDHGYEETLKAVGDALSLLQLEYVDMFLIHWPVPMRGLFCDTFRALAKAKEQGLTKSIGVSNFTAEQLEVLINETGLIPAINQIEIHPYLTQKSTIEYCKEKGIAVQAWSPLAKGMIFKDEKLLEIAQKHGKTPAQIVLRWDYQNGILTIPKSVNVERVVSNTEIFDFELSADEMAAIDSLNRDERTGPDPNVFERLSLQ